MTAPSQTRGRSASPDAPRFTIVIPVYNCQDYIRETLDGVLSARIDGCQIIVVNDGSTDRTLDIVESRHDPRMTVITQPNRGLAAARNTGLAQARGKYVLFVDADDPVFLERFEPLARHLDVNGHVVVAYGNYVRITASGRSLGIAPRGRLTLKPSGDVLEAMMRRNWVGSIGTALIRRSAAVEIGGFNEALPINEDWEFLCRMASVGHFQFVPEVVTTYRQHVASMSSTKSLRLSLHLAATEALFGNRRIRDALDKGRLARVRRDHEAHIHRYISCQYARQGQFRPSLSQLVEIGRKAPLALLPAIAAVAYTALSSRGNLA